MKILSILCGASLLALVAGPALAQGTSPGANTSAAPSKEADKMRSDDKAGSTPNASIPGANPAADGNATQDSRTTTTKDR